jgi:hypothetical protein
MLSFFIFRGQTPSVFGQEPGTVSLLDLKYNWPGAQSSIVILIKLLLILAKKGAMLF